MNTSREALRRLAVGTLMPGFVGTTVPAWIEREYAAGLASVCLYGANVVDPDQLAQLCASLRAMAPDLLVAVDEEGGDVTRLHYPTGSTQPGNALLGRLDDTVQTRASAAAIGRELAAYGINLDLAPVVDVNSADENPVIGVRSFGAEAAHVARHSAAYVDGVQSVGVAACAKHFPGHGDTVTDSHHGLPRVHAEAHVLDARELEPFRAAIDARVACIMTSHVVVSAIDPERPATFSPVVLGDVLRDRLGFEGVIVSDALDMAGASAETGIPEAAVRALVAGCDLLCVGSETPEDCYLAVVEAVVQAAVSGRLPLERLEEAAARVVLLSQGFAVDGPGAHGRDADVAAPAWANGALVGGFEVGDAVRTWLDAPGDAVIVQVASDPNLAVGRVAWGPGAAGLTTPEADVPEAARVAVAGRGLAAGHPVWEVADRFRAQGHPTIVVDCGWPRGGADLVTFGGSVVVAQALGRYLGVPAR
ncbi:beta-N-acetylhexosaminidase [Terrabacter sp. Ter38]|uniref:beta-N-acetylhexosaminidase n=1 Tax=Terrabacter sp. Ter38 TaxID=2926030 RepID=UPI00211757D2|nr:beta-N-acetylhexosaminidase [Terrabacter sp. Ter38]